MGPLSGIRVLDFSRLLPGPYASLVLADLGAQVDKVEDPDGGDFLRQVGPKVAGEGSFFYGLNRNKRSIALDLKSPKAVAAILRLVPCYDILIEGFRPGAMAKLGLDYPALSKQHPGLIYCSISGYGQTGPDRLKAGHDLNYVARAGLLGLGGPPSLPGGQVADIGGGSLFGLVGILASLIERGRTGVGRHLDISMTEGAIAFIHMHLGAHLSAGPAPSQPGLDRPLHGGHPGYGIYPAADGRWLAVAALEPKFFLRLCESLGLAELAGQFFAGRRTTEEARAALSGAFKRKTAEAWQRQLAPLDVCVELVADLNEVVSDPQLQARRVVGTGEEPGVGPMKYLRTPSAFSPPPFLPPPKVGEHTRAILEEAGLPPAEIAELVDR